MDALSSVTPLKSDTASDSVAVAAEHVFVPPRYSQDEARAAVADSLNFNEALRRLGMRSAGGNWRTLRKYAERWGISTDHFDAGAHRRQGVPRARRPLNEILVERSSYSRWHLKRRLFEEGFKERRCEMCGQGELWRGRRMALILDHINGVADDNRLENLQIVCPNCAATLDTHCGKQNRTITERACEGCGEVFQPDARGQRFCSRTCYWRDQRGRPEPSTRKVERPPYNHLVREVRALGYLATGRRYGVSDNAVRKWLRWYEREHERLANDAQRARTA